MKHHYCLFYKNDRLQFGWIKEQKKNRISIVPEQGKEFDCALGRVEYIWKGKIIEIEKEALHYLSDQSKWSYQEADKIELDVIHELCDPGISYTLDELAKDFLEEADNGWMRTALLLRLKKDARLFQQKKNQFIARSSEEILLLDEKEGKKEEAVKKQLVEQSWASDLLNNQTPSVEKEQEDHWKQFIHRLQNFAIHLDKSQEKIYFCSLFQLQLKDYEKTEQKLLGYLAKTELSLSWGKLILERSSALLTFSDEENQAVDKFQNQSEWESRFNCSTIDQRNLDTYSVDNAETKDFDDALSWMETEEGCFALVHITDVASLIHLEDILFDGASERFSTLYTIKEIFPMFPQALSEDKFSLVQGADRAVLTFEFRIDDSGHISSSKIFRSIINVDRNCTYSEIDSAIERNESFWGKLWKVCQHHQEVRKNNGSLELDRHEIRLDISDPESIEIASVRENTPASLMIQELAILTNHCAASYAQEYGLPCLFRNQPPYSINKELQENEKPTLKDINIQPARISLNSEGHSALGLDCYLQISSPIRRFLDLVNQGIVMSHLGSFPMEYEEERLLEWARRGEEIQKEFNQIERKLTDHWKIKYLAQHKDDLYEALLNRYLRNGKAQINLIKLQLNLEASLDNLPEDEVFQVCLDKVDAGLNKVVIRKVATPGSSLSEEGPDLNQEEIE
jgi:exoribonuclease II